MYLASAATEGTQVLGGDRFDVISTLAPVVFLLHQNQFRDLVTTRPLGPCLGEGCGPGQWYQG